jgi:hypothetical protein
MSWSRKGNEEEKSGEGRGRVVIGLPLVTRPLVTRTAGKRKLRVPHMKFNRQIGDYAGEFYRIEGNPLNEGEFQAHTTQVLPGPADQTRRVAKRRYV